MAVKFSESGVTGTFGTGPTENIVGFETGTVGIGGSPKIRLGHVQGVESLDHNTVAIKEPLRLGRFIGAWLRLPPFLHEEMRDWWYWFLEDNILEVSGLTDNEVSKLTRTTGAVQREDEYLGYYKENNNMFTIKVPEFKGSPVRKLMKYYLGAVSDPVTGTAHYYGKPNFRHTKINYSGDFIYILLGESMRPDDIHFSCMWFHAFPNKDFIGHLNSGTIGDAGAADLSFDIDFSGTYVQSDVINRIAQKVVEAKGLYKDTRETQIIPAEYYEKYLGETLSSDLQGRLGADLASRITNAAAEGSEAATQLEGMDDSVLNNTSTVTPSGGTTGETTFSTESN